MSWITVYDEMGDYYVNTDHVSKVCREDVVTMRSGERENVTIVSVYFQYPVRIIVKATPNVSSGLPEEIYQDIIDQIGGNA